MGEILTIIKIKVIPNASKTEVVEWEGEILKIRLNAPPDKGKANAELISFLAKKLKIAKSKIKILSGTTSRLKRVSIEEMTINQIKSIG